MSALHRPPVSSSAVQPAVTQSVGTRAHQRAVRRLLTSYAAIPPGNPVRLAKRTSNLFRPRASTSGAGLNVAGLGGVIAIDTVTDPATGQSAATADVQGVCTYEHLVNATLPRGYLPYVVPQLRTITLGGAVTGLGIESTSFRNGLPHESVLELDVLTGAGEVVTVTPDGEHAALFRGFPNSYGTLGYAVRLRIALERVHPYVSLRHIRFDTLDDLGSAIASICRERSWDGRGVDFCDGVVFSPQESYLTLGSWADDALGARSGDALGAGSGDARRAARPSDYTGSQIYYRSLRERTSDLLTVHDYVWRWDTDWFWCSRAFGAQHPTVRRYWPRAMRRSDVYHRIVGLENRFHVAARVEKWRGRPERERVVQDVEIPLERTADFLRWFAEHVPMTPVWVCPLQLRRSGGPLGTVPDGEQPWTLYPLRAGVAYVNVGFWGTVPIEAGRGDGDVNRLIEAAVDEFGGHKSLYSDSYYDEADFWARYGGAEYGALKERYDPDGRLLDLYAKAVRRR